MTTLAREGEAFNAYETFVIITCYKCGIPFGVPDYWKQKRHEDQESFWCPNGHSQHYSESKVTQLRRKLEQTEQKYERERQWAESARRQRDETRKTYRKMRERVKNGVCPCCNRTFHNLLEHMRTKHPELGDQQTLRQLRESYGLTQGALAEEMGVSLNHVSQFETGRSVTAWARDQIEAWMEDQ